MDEPVTQANVWRLDTELTDEESRAWHEAIAAGRGKVRFLPGTAPWASVLSPLPRDGTPPDAGEMRRITGECGHPRASE